MKLGMNLYLWTTHLDQQHLPLLETLSAAGFDGVEIPVSDYSVDEIQAIRQALANTGLACTAATLFSGEPNPIAMEPARQAAAIEKIKQDIELAHALGAESLVGPIHSAHKEFPGRGPTAAEFERCVAFLQAASDLAGDALQLAVEPLNRFECYFLNRQADGKRLADAVDRHNVGILYDSHHAHIEENDVASGIEVLAGRANHIHISESHRGTPGGGQVDWANTFQAIKAIGYDGWLTIEAFASDVEGIPAAVNIWRDCFASKEEVYQAGIALMRSYQ